ncbi:nucleobindin-2-like [Saccoglossus kowalevskii]|uniref:Nucleobindin-2-like n=1 Tax=Saccoglossus kowalevskii TaxID=10224 RepID=A0ABM0GJ20_SACKO|nr:PREDICTED: nucleobindin-2-like [Saccoglossus kowalevskii]
MFMLKQCLPWLILAAAITVLYSAPVNVNENEVDDKDFEDSFLLLDYRSYFRQVGEILTDDPVILDELKKLSDHDIESGNVSHVLQFAHKTIRDKLDELKSEEINRLRSGISKSFKAARESNATAAMKESIANSIKDYTGHIEMKMQEFRPEDLQLLIKKAHEDITRINQLRKDDFKKGAMEKEIQRRKELLNLSLNERKVQEEKFAEEKLKESKHEEVNHPGSKKQLEEVWEKTDQLEKEFFDPKVFFRMHDINADGFLDILEVEALLIKEVDKIYGEDGDPSEKTEEISRMREHVYNEVDQNKDDLINQKEFVESISRDQDEEGWEDLRDNPIYTEDELNEYNKKMEELQEVKDNATKKRQDRANNKLTEQQQTDDNIVRMQV